MPRIKPVFVLLFFSFVFINETYSQQDMMLWGLDRVPQQRFVNPAYVPQCKFFIGIPASSSIYFNFSNSGFNLSSLLKKDGDSMRVDINRFLKNIKRNNYITTNLNLELISFGFAVDKNYFSFALTEKVFLRATLPGDLFRLALEGNVQFIDQPANFTGMGVNMAHYREYAFGYNRKLNSKFTIGGALKYLYGMENIRTKDSRIAFMTDPSNFALKGNTDILVQTSGFGFISSPSFSSSLGKYLFNSKNHGMGIDLGVNYTLNKKVSITASVIDMGFISWKSDVKNYYTNNSSFIYEGEELSKVLSEDGQINYLGHFVDTIKASIDIKESNEAYSTPLNTRIYLGGDYKFNEKTKGRVLFYSEFYNKAIHPALSLSVSYRVGKVLEVCGGYSAINRGFFNMGLGATLSLGAFQWYMMTDNVFGNIFPQHFRNVQLRTGFNLIFGKREPKVATPKIEGIGG